MPKEQLVVGATGTPASQTVSGEQGETSTILSFVNGVGKVCPPMVIHCGQHVQQYWMKDVLIGWHVAATTKDYIMKHKFHEYGIRFVQYLKTRHLLDLPHLLIVDSHKSHVYNVASFEEMLENNIHVLAIPPHTSHIVQALDSTPFVQFKQNLQRLLLEYNFDKHGQVLGKSDFLKVLKPAWSHAMTVSQIQSGFRKTGIYPVNFNAIDKNKFTPSEVTDSKTSVVYVGSFCVLTFMSVIVVFGCFVNVSMFKQKSTQPKMYMY